MIKVTFTGMRERLQTLDRLEREQLPFAAALSLTAAAQEVKKALVEEMRSVFDRPTRWTLNSVFIEPATKERMEARVWLKDEKPDAGGTPDAEDLAPQIYGGGREYKGTEKMLYRRGALGSGQYVLPGDKLQLDRHGNIGRGKLTKMLSGAGLFTQEGYDANATDSTRSRRKGNHRFFLMRKGRAPIGIAERVGWGKGSRNNIRMVLVFGRRPSYSKRFDFFGSAEAVAQDVLPIEFEKAMARALATRRR